MAGEPRRRGDTAGLRGGVGRNLLKGTTTPGVTTGTNTSNQCDIDWEFAAGSLKALGAGTYSFYADVVSSTGVGTVQLQLNGTPWNAMPKTQLTTSTQRLGWTFTLTDVSSSGATGVNVRLDNATGTVTVSHAKFETGSVPHDWDPAPED